MRLGAAIIVALSVLCAHAQAASVCIEVSGERAASSVTRRVTAGSALRVDAACEYATSASGPWRKVAEDARPRDYAALWIALGGRDATTAPASIYARRASEGAGVESVFLAACTEHLLGPGHGFEMRVPSQLQQPRVSRTSAGNDCGASEIALRFARPWRDTSAPLVHAGPWEQTLTPERSELTLGAGRWVVYAGRADSEAALLVGRIDAGAARTPLAAALELMGTAERPEPWLRASWRTGELRLEAVSEALSRSDAWAELRAAAAAQALWLVRDAPNAPRTYLAPVALADGGTALVPAIEPLRAHLRARYGSAADAVVPSIADWAGAHDGVSVCLPARYTMPATGAASPHAAIALGDPVPGDAICAPLAAMIASLSTGSGGTGPRGELCLRRRARMLGVANDYIGPLIGERCVTLPTRGEPAMTLAVVGDEIAFNGEDAGDLFVCIDNACEPLPPDRAWLRLERSGLVEIRQGDRPSVARMQMGLTLLRFGVLDPRREWQPIGLYDAGGPPSDDRWSMLDHDEDNRFVYERAWQRLQFGMSMSPALVAVYNAQTATPAQLTADVPLLSPTDGGVQSPRPAALVALATASSACPNAPAAVVRRGGLVDPQRMLVDQVFYVHLAHHRGEGLPYDCLATAGFRVTESLTQRVNAGIRLGLLGDVQMMLMLNRPAALGVGLPLAYGRWRWPYGFGLDASALVTTAVAFEDAGLTRAGGGLAASVYWGPEQYAPRLLSAGIMLHATAGTTGRDEPLVTAFGALDLSTLFDLAGGR